MKNVIPIDQKCDTTRERAQKAFAIGHDVFLYPFQLYHPKRYQRCVDGDSTKKWSRGHSIHQNLC